MYSIFECFIYGDINKYSEALVNMGMAEGTTSNDDSIVNIFRYYNPILIEIN